MSKVNDLGIAASEQYDRDYKRGVADLITGQITLAYIQGASDACAGKAYDPVNEHAMESTSSYMDTVELHISTEQLKAQADATYNSPAYKEFKAAEAAEISAIRHSCRTSTSNAEKVPSIYGYCPICLAPGNSRERRPDGNDVCLHGHTYPSAKALPSLPTNQT